LAVDASSGGGPLWIATSSGYAVLQP
jgi:hypothetical protein